jgi:hypothetical protein
VKIDYVIKDKKIVELVITDSSGITSSDLRQISISTLVNRELFDGASISPTAKGYLKNAAKLIITHIKTGKSPVKILVENLGISPRTAANYVAEIKKEKVIQWETR